MKKKIIIVLIVLILVTVVYAADVKWSALVELVDIADDDVLCVIDTSAGTSKKITVVNFFDTIDTSAELLAILTNETGTGALVFATSPTLVTPILGTITSGVGTALTALNGENIQDDTIDVDSIDWSVCTLANFDFETNWKMWHSNAAGDVTEITLGADGTFLESNGAAAAPAFRVLADGDVPDNITIDLATLASTVTTADDEATADNQEIVFTTTPVGAATLETDGDFHYNPSTGTVTATQFVGGGAGLTLASTDLSDTAALLYETELDSFAELDTQIADKALINLADGGTFTGNIIANANLSVGNATTTAGVLTLLEDDDDGANFASFMVPALAANTVYTLPPDDGDNTEVLQTNGAGVLTWVAAGAGDMTRAVYDSGLSGGVDVLTTVDSTYASDYVLLTGTAVGTAAPKTDGALTYDATSGTLAATQFSGGGASLTSVDAITGDSATGFFDAGTIEHEWGGLQANISAYTGLIAITGADTTAEIDSKAELEGQIADVADFAEADGDVYTGNADFGGADLELPQASPAVPDADGEVEVDFTDGTVVIQHGSAHAELGASTDVVVGKLIDSFSATLAMPDGLQSEIDNWPLKAIESTEFPHGIVITRIRIKTSAASTYAINVENWDDPTTINAANPTIDAITTSASTEATEDTITYSTIAAGQIIMLDLPITDIGWVMIVVEYYEPAT